AEWTRAQRAAAWIDYFERHAHEPTTFYAGHPGPSAASIRALETARSKLVGTRARRPLVPADVAAATDGIDFAALPAARRYLLPQVCKIVGVVYQAIATLVYLLAAGPLLLLFEGFEDATVPPIDDARLRMLEAADEDPHRTQNHLTHLVPIKPGWL